MKASSHKLGLTIQLCLMRQGLSLEALAQQLDMNADSLSNLIHGRRQFKDPLLKKLADTSIIRNGKLSLAKLRALRAMDSYSFEELLLAVLESLRQGAVEDLDEACFARLRAELALGGFPEDVSEKQAALLELIR